MGTDGVRDPHMGTGPLYEGGMRPPIGQWRPPYEHAPGDPNLGTETPRGDADGDPSTGPGTPRWGHCWAAGPPYNRDPQMGVLMGTGTPRGSEKRPYMGTGTQTPIRGLGIPYRDSPGVWKPPTRYQRPPHYGDGNRDPYKGMGTPIKGMGTPIKGWGPL